MMQPGSFSHTGTLQGCFVVSSQNVLTPSELERDKDDPPVMLDVIISRFHMTPYNLLYLKYVSQTVQILLVIF